MGVDYPPVVRDLFARLPRCGALAAGPGSVAAGAAGSPEQGAWVILEARVAAGRIADCAFRAWGCPYTLAAAALVAGRLVGQPVGAAAVPAAAALAGLLEAPAEKLGRLLVVEDATAALLRHAGALQLG